MPITFHCDCGTTLRVPDEYAGSNARCPSCETILTVPTPKQKFEVVEEAEGPGVVEGVLVPAKPPTARVVKHDEGEDGRGYGVARADRDDRPRGRRRAEGDTRRPRPRRRYRRQRPGESAWLTIKRVLFASLGGIMLLGGVLLAIDGLTNGNAWWVVRGVCVLFVGGPLLYVGLTGQFPDR